MKMTLNNHTFIENISSGTKIISQRTTQRNLGLLGAGLACAVIVYLTIPEVKTFVDDKILSRFSVRSPSIQQSQDAVAVTNIEGSNQPPQHAQSQVRNI